jgi:hypothetical protein
MVNDAAKVEEPGTCTVMTSCSDVSNGNPQDPSSAHPSLLDRLACILLYDGNQVDVIINYALLLLNLGGACFGLLLRSTSGDALPVRQSQVSMFLKASAAFGFVVAFQLVLCLIVGCMGISIIWCALAGWILCERRHKDRSGRQPHDQEQGCEEASELLLNEENEQRRPGPSESAAISPSAEQSPPTERIRPGSAPSTSSPPTSIIHRRILSPWPVNEIVLALDGVVVVYYLATQPIITTVAHFCALLLGAFLWWLV